MGVTGSRGQAHVGWDGAPMGRDSGALEFSLCSKVQERPLAGVVRRRPSASQRERSPQNPTLRALCSQAPSLRTVRKYISVPHELPVYNVYLFAQRF